MSDDFRDSSGRFMPGNKFSRGRPAGKRRQEFAEGFYSRLEAAQAGERLADAFIEALDKGHLRAAASIYKTVTEYTEGKPGVRQGDVSETAAELIERYASSYDGPLPEAETSDNGDSYG